MALVTTRTPSRKHLMCHLHTGADLSNYGEQLSTFNTKRMLNLRLSHNLNKDNELPLQVKFYNTAKRSNSQILSSEIEPDESVINLLLQICTETSVSKLREIAEKLMDNQILTRTLFSSQETIETFVCALENSSSVIIQDQLLQVLAIIYPQLDEEKQNLFVDLGLFMPFYTYLDVQSDLLITALSVIATTSECSVYARDTIICLGFHSIIIELCANNPGTEIATCSSQCIHKILSNESAMEESLLRETTPLIYNLLNNQSVETKREIILCLVDISNQMSTINVVFYELGLYNDISDIISNECFIDVGLRLLGNMSIAQQPQIQALIDSGVYDILDTYLDSEYSSKVFWILSNSIDSFPELSERYASEEFMARAISVAQDGGYEAKREAGFFLATVALCPLAAVPPGAIPGFVAVVAEVLGCGVRAIAGRCVAALIRLSDAEGFTDACDSADLCDRLCELAEEGGEAGEAAAFLMDKIRN